MDKLVLPAAEQTVIGAHPHESILIFHESVNISQVVLDIQGKLVDLIFLQGKETITRCTDPQYFISIQV